MGAATSCVDSLVGTSPPEVVDWTALGSEGLYGFLSSDAVLKQQTVVAACSSVCANTIATGVLWKVAGKAVEQQDLQLSANLLLMLRVFFAVVFAERIPYRFVYISENTPDAAESPTAPRAEVAITVHFQGVSRTVTLSVPTTHLLDLRTETNRFTIELFRHFEALREFRGDTVIFCSADGEVIDIADIARRSQQEDLHLWAKLVECKRHAGDFYGEMAAFLTRLVRLYLALPSPQASTAVLRSKHAALCCLCTLLSSHLFYAKRQTAKPTYSDLKASPAVDLLFRMSPDVASHLLQSLLQDFTASYQWLPRTQSYMGQVVSALWTPGQADNIRDELGTAALTLSLLLLNYDAAVRNPFLSADLRPVADSLQVRLVALLENTSALLLLFVLLRDNDSFRANFTSSAEHDRYLPRLCELAHSATLPPTQVYLVLSIFLVLSSDRAFTRFLNREVSLGGVPWLQYSASGISLGSLLLLVVVKVFRDNLSAKDEYTHVTTVAVIYNLAREAVRLHEATAQYILATLVHLWRRRKSPDTSLDLFLDLFAVLLRHTYRDSPWLVYMTLREEDAFRQMEEAEIATGVVAGVQELIRYCLERMAGENVLEDVARLARDFTFSQPLQLSYLSDVQFFSPCRDRTWEQWAIPVVWSCAQSEGLRVSSSSLMRLTGL